jgi:hypothetical protein
MNPCKRIKDQPDYSNVSACPVNQAEPLLAPIPARGRGIGPESRILPGKDVLRNAACHRYLVLRLNPNQIRNKYQ